MPLFFLPMVTDPWGFGKNWLLTGSVVVGLVLWVVAKLVEKDGEVWVNGMLKWWLVLGIWTILSFWRLESGVRMRSVMTLGGWSTMIALVGWLWLWLQVSDKEEREKQINWLTVSGLLVVVSSLVVFLIPSVKLPISWPKDNPMLVINSTFSLTGSLMVELVLVAFLLTEWLKRLVVKMRTGGLGYIFEAVVTAGLMLGVGIVIFRLSKTGWVWIDNTSAWMIAAETFKAKPLWGVGAGNFLEAFGLYRPASYNLTSFWSSIFGGSRYGGLQLWTELGLVGLAIIGLMVTTIVSKRKNSFEWWRVLIFGLVFLLTPLTWVTWWLMVWLVAGEIFGRRKLKMVIRAGENGFNVAPWLVGVIIVGLSVWGGWYWLRILKGEIVMRGALVAASKNDGVKTYNEQIKAIGDNPWSAEYRKVYSQTNLALAKTILANKELTDEDRQRASVLVEQSVREAKAAVALDNNNATYWANLAVIYRDLIGVVDGAADWSYQAYVQAVALEPTNPLLRLDLGGLLFAANRMEEADRVFEMVVQNKPDFANGWYNWAHTAKNLNKLDVAVQRLAQAVALVPVDSGDYEKASEELVVWRKELDEVIRRQQEAMQQQQAKEAETLRTAEPLPTGVGEKVNVPKEDLEPPEMVVTPTEAP